MVLHRRLHRHSITVTVFLISGAFLLMLENIGVQCFGTEKLKFTKYAMQFSLDTTPFSHTTTKTTTECFAQCVREKKRCAYLVFKQFTGEWACQLFSLVHDLSASLVKQAATPPTTMYKVEMPNIDCQTLMDHGITLSKVYDLVLDRTTKYKAYCEMNGTLEEGWTIINRRSDGAVNFARNWEAYEDGGSPFIFIDFLFSREGIQGADPLFSVVSYIIMKGNNN